jgi:membrane protease YdiL (CAAX protease family)
MVDELLDLRTCRLCGGPIHDREDTEQANDDVCARCALAGSVHPGAESRLDLRGTEAESFLYDKDSHPPPRVDPDNPPWSTLTGIATWIFSIAASIVVPVIPLFLVVLAKAFSGAPADSVRAWIESSGAVLVLLIATFPAHALILLFCWAVVTHRGKRPFFQTLGWNWAGRSAIYWCLVAVGVVIAINAASNFLLRWLPEQTSPFEELLKSSQPARIATVLLAILTAPLVEEIVYRGVLFSALRKRLSAAATVLSVTVIFVGVHVPQYRGAWRTIAGLTLLSLALTIFRARTSSVLPSFLIHLVNNALSSIAIMSDTN